MRKKAKLKLTDVLFVLLCLLASLFCLVKFWLELNKTFSKKETPIAVIEYKYKIAQRKILDELVWDRLRQKSDVYNGDTIRIAPQAEATIYCVDKNSIELHENTMVQIFLVNGTLQLSSSYGKFSAKTESKMIIKYGNNIINLDANSKASFDSSANGFSIQMEKGNAVLQKDGGNYEINQGIKTMLQDDGTMIQSHLVVLNPSVNQRIINFEKDAIEYDFEWNSDINNILIETSPVKDFSRDVSKKIVKNVSKSSINVPNGVTFWKVTTLPEENSKISSETVAGKINSIYSPVPELISPKEDSITTYRNKLPSIRLSWTESEKASSYELKIADNKQMNNPVIVKRASSCSYTVTTLEKGNWYWTVTPFYITDDIGYGKTSLTGHFEIKQSFEMQAPVLLLPKDSDLVSTKVQTGTTKAYKNIVFSWQDEPEASFYEIKIWGENSASTPVVKENVNKNYFSLDTSKVDLANGLWYWQVSVNDSDGKSKDSEIRKFYAVDAELEQRTLFPPDGYHLAESRSQDIKFSWKTNISNQVLFEIARDIEFTQIVSSETVSNFSTNGRLLKPGTYYWRISSKIGSFKKATEPKTLYIDEPLKPAELINPINGSRVIVRPGSKYKFRWKTVENADYYSIKIARASSPENYIVEQNFIEPSNPDVVEFSLDLSSWEEVKYVWTVQAFREESPMASRLTGYLSTSNFLVKQLKPVKLISPLNNVIYDGANAIKSPGFVEWSSVDEPKKTKLVIYKDRISEENITYAGNNPSFTEQLPVLYEGTYFWKIVASTYDGYDISSQETRKFTVTEIPKLDAPKKILPVEKQKFNGTYFKENRTIMFKWESVPEAEQYIFRLKNSKNKVISEQVLDKNTLEFELKDLSILEKGKLKWSVEAQSLYQGIIFQQGKVEDSSLTIDLPSVKTKLKNPGRLYGK